jgi:hypothetical protein
MGDCREHLLLSGGIAFTAGWSQADYLRPLRVYLERLIAKASCLRAENRRPAATDFVAHLFLP